MKLYTFILSFLHVTTSIFAEKKTFDGNSLKGWNGDPKFWSVQDGAILGQTTKENPTKGTHLLFGKVGVWEILN